jgi:ornithine cyclodeaminase
MLQISSEQISDHCHYPTLIEALKDAFKKEYKIPKRHHHQYPNPKEGIESTLLLMPAWDDGENLGVKVVNVSPNNSQYNLPTIQGNYLLYDQQKGSLKAIFDAKMLTNKRTAAASALASSFLSKVSAQSLLMIGNGSLAPELIKAHASVRPLNKVYVWGRNFGKSQKICSELSSLNLEIVPIENYKEVISEADIISCATLSTDPLIFGRDLRKGQHFDLVGAYKPDMREADNDFISTVSIHVDNYEGATTETGDLAIPLKEGVISIDDIYSDLFELCKEKKAGRQSEEEITCFKSVGHALEDLAAAKLIYNAVIASNEAI